MRNVTHADRVLLVDVGQERALVVDAEVENAVLVRQDKGSPVDSSVGGRVDGFQVEAVEGRQHREFELQSVLIGGSEWAP